MGFMTEGVKKLREDILESRGNREEFRRQLESRTAERRAEISGLRKSFAQDLAGARRAWSGSAPVKPRVAASRARFGSAPAVPAAGARVSAPAKKSAKQRKH